jgi:hypothetical protein
MTQVRLISEWIDNAGGFLRASSWVFATPGLATYEAAVQACSNAVLQFATNGIPSVSTATPGSGQYNLTTDTAVLIFQTGAGTGVRVVIPGPMNSIFGANSSVVDPTNASVAALIAAVIGTLGDAGGNVVTAYVSGIKSSRRSEQE